MMIFVNGQPISDYRYHQKASKRFEFSDMELEERNAARFCNYSWSQYLDFPGCAKWINPENPSDDKCSIVAYYRVMSRMDSVANDFPPPKGK